jgi:hypothetical protein
MQLNYADLLRLLMTDYILYGRIGKRFWQLSRRRGRTNQKDAGFVINQNQT